LKEKRTSIITEMMKHHFILPFHKIKREGIIYQRGKFYYKMEEKYFK